MDTFDSQAQSGLAWVAERFERLLDNVEQVIHGKREVVPRAATCMLAIRCLPPAGASTRSGR